jgi:hypothetical protein
MKAQSVMGRYGRLPLAFIAVASVASLASVDATCEATLTFTVLGQPNIGVGFLDTTASFTGSIVLGETTLKSDGTTANVTVICDADELKVVFSARGTAGVYPLNSTGWDFDARATSDAVYTWRTKVSARRL